MLSKQALAERIGKRIREARERQKITQEELAHKAGLYRTYVGFVEVGRYTPSVYTLYKLAKALDIKSIELLDF